MADGEAAGTRSAFAWISRAAALLAFVSVVALAASIQLRLTDEWGKRNLALWERVLRADPGGQPRQAAALALVLLYVLYVSKAWDRWSTRASVVLVFAGATQAAFSVGYWVVELTAGTKLQQRYGEPPVDLADFIYDIPSFAVATVVAVGGWMLLRGRHEAGDP